MEYKDWTKENFKEAYEKMSDRCANLMRENEILKLKLKSVEKFVELAKQISSE